MYATNSDTMKPNLKTPFNCAIADSLFRFQPHSLEALNGANLMNRVDTKFLIKQDLIPTLLEQLTPYFTALEIENRRIFRYQSTYFDTDNFMFYNMHHRGHLNRFKVRVREYLDSKSQFLEVKFKNNKNRTIKKRVQIPHTESLSISNFSEFLNQTGIAPNLDLRPCQTSKYNRIALASEARKERLTIDLNIENTFKIEDEIGSHCLTGLAVIELKQEKLNRCSPVFLLAKKLNLRSSGFSKYCMGMVYTTKDKNIIKINRFKRVCRRVNSTLSA